MAQVKTVFLDAEGESHRSPQPGIVAMHILYPDLDPIVVTHGAVHEDNRSCAFWHGMKQKLGDKRAGKDAEEGYDETISLLERLCESANWNLAREGAGPRVSMTGEAIARVLVAAGKADASDLVTLSKEKAEACRDQTKDSNGNTYKEQAEANPAVNEMLETIKTERQAVRLAAAKVASAGVESNIDTL